jgi:cytidylate kinase
MGRADHGARCSHALAHGCLTSAAQPDTASPEALARWLHARPARAGGTRVLAVEGRSGAGKSTFADRVADELAAPVVRMDDLYDGWDGLLAGANALLEWVLLPLSLGRPPRWRRYDWDRGEYAEWHTAAVSDALVVEGVGSGARQARQYLSGLVWLEAGEGVRKERALARDGEVYGPHWSRWAAQEERYHAAHGVRARADLTIVTG